MEWQLLSKKQAANINSGPKKIFMWLKNALFHVLERHSGKVALAVSSHKQFDATETDWKMNASDAEEPEILQMAYGYKDWRINVVYHSLSKMDISVAMKWALTVDRLVWTSQW